MTQADPMECPGRGGGAGRWRGRAIALLLVAGAGLSALVAPGCGGAPSETTPAPAAQIVPETPPRVVAGKVKGGRARVKVDTSTRRERRATGVARLAPG